MYFPQLTWIWTCSMDKAGAMLRHISGIVWRIERDKVFQ